MAGQAQAPRRRRPWLIVYWVTFGLLGAAFVGLLVGAFTTAAVVTVPGAGMAPTVPVGSRVIYQRGATGVVRGDIVLVRVNGVLFLRRLIGLPGDHVSCCTDDARISVNGKVLIEDYVSTVATPYADTRFNVSVPPGEIWVMGDDRGGAIDSRQWGPIPMSDILGRAFIVSGSGSQTLLRTPAVFTANRLAPADHRRPLAIVLLEVAAVVLLVMVVQGVVGLIVWLVRRGRRKRTRQPQPAAW